MGEEDRIAKAKGSGETPADALKDISETPDGDELLMQVVEQRALKASANASSDEIESRVEETEEKLLMNNKTAEGVAKQIDSATGLKMSPGSAKETVETPTLPREVASPPESRPGAFSVDPVPSNDRQNEEEIEEATEEEPTTQGEDFPALDARLVDETVTAPRARVSRATNHQASNMEYPPTDVEQGLPPALEGIKAPTKEHPQGKMLLMMNLVCIFLLLVIIVLMVLGFTGVLNDEDKASTSSAGNNITDLSGMTTLQRIQATGQLRCGDIFLTNGFMYYDRKTGRKTGFYAELCHALAAALSVKAVFVPPAKKWAYLQQVATYNQSWAADVAIIGHTHNMERNVKGALEGIQEGLSFSTPMLYGGTKIGGDHFHITQCVDKGMKHIEECSSLRVCIDNMTTHYATIGALMNERFFVPSKADGIANFAGLKDGRCNVMVQGMFQLSYPNAAKQGVTNYSVSESFFSKEPMAMVTKSTDPEFSDFVKSVLQALLVAEQHNITKATAETFPQTNLFGPQYKDMFRKAIGHAGNYGELYSQFLDEYIPRSSLNLLNNGTGLLYSMPWGRLEKFERNLDARPLGSIMQSILNRGILHCGIRTGRPGFAERLGSSYVGMETDLCKAIAFGLFQGKPNAVTYVELKDSTDGFVKLASGEVDVSAGALWSIVNDVKEPTTGMGFAFSQPYFYGYSKEEDNFALATRQDDHDWASFVFWTLTALINAEENKIHSNTSIAMPEQLLFGERLKRMLRDVLLSSGNFGEIYARHLEKLYHRSGRNMLNAIPDVGPQYYPLPGFFP